MLNQKRQRPIPVTSSDRETLGQYNQAYEEITGTEGGAGMPSYGGVVAWPGGSRRLSTVPDDLTQGQLGNRPLRKMLHQIPDSDTRRRVGRTADRVSTMQHRLGDTPDDTKDVRTV